MMFSLRLSFTLLVELIEDADRRQRRRNSAGDNRDPD